MMYRVEWEMNIGLVHKIVPESEVLEFAKSISDLGFAVSVLMESDE